MKFLVREHRGYEIIQEHTGVLRGQYTYTARTYAGEWLDGSSNSESGICRLVDEHLDKNKNDE